MKSGPDRQCYGYYVCLLRVVQNGPRAGVNFNDGGPGGEVLEGNLIYNFVRETGDHVRPHYSLILLLRRAPLGRHLN